MSSHNRMNDVKKKKLSLGFPGLTVTGMYSYGGRLGARHLGFKKTRNFTFHEARTKALIKYAVSVQRTCEFVLVYVKIRLSQGAAQM